MTEVHTGKPVRVWRADGTIELHDGTVIPPRKDGLNTLHGFAGMRQDDPAKAPTLNAGGSVEFTGEQEMESFA